MGTTTTNRATGARTPRRTTAADTETDYFNLPTAGDGPPGRPAGRLVDAALSAWRTWRDADRELRRLCAGDPGPAALKMARERAYYSLLERDRCWSALTPERRREVAGHYPRIGLPDPSEADAEPPIGVLTPGEIAEMSTARAAAMEARSIHGCA